MIVWMVKMESGTKWYECNLNVCLKQFKTDDGEEQTESIQKNKHDNPTGFIRWLLEHVSASCFIGSYYSYKMPSF